MTTHIIKSTFSKFLSAFLTIALIIVYSFGPQLAIAASFTSSKDTATRLKINTDADHVFVFTLPTGVTFDVSTNTDIIRADFPSTFTLGGTWATSDFAFNDGTARTVNAVASGGGTIDVTCTDATNNVGVAIDTTAKVFTVKPCGASFTASGSAATVTFTIFGTAGGGTVTNPASVAATNIDLAMCDETASCTSSFTTTHSSQIAYGIADDDQVNVTATVNSTLTFDLDVGTAGSENTGAPYNVPLGALSTSDVKVSGATDGINRIMMDLDTNAPSGVVVTVKNANGANGLVSTSTPADKITNTATAMATNTTNYGLCVISVTQSTGTLSKASPYNTGTCAADGGTNDVKGLTTTGDNMVSSSGLLAGGRAQVAVNASISGSVPAHNDYADTLTFIATATF